MSLCLSHPVKLLVLFWPPVLHVALYKKLFLDFWFRPKRPKFTPQNLHKIAYKSACMAYRLEMFGPTRGFSGWLIQWNNAKCCGADPCCHGNEIWARRGDTVAYQLVNIFTARFRIQNRKKNMKRSIRAPPRRLRNHKPADKTTAYGLLSDSRNIGWIWSVVLVLYVGKNVYVYVIQ